MRSSTPRHVSHVAHLTYWTLPRSLERVHIYMTLLIVLLPGTYMQRLLKKHVYSIRLSGLSVARLPTSS